MDGLDTAPIPRHTATLVQFGEFTLDRSASELRHGDRPIKLPRQQFTILSVLVDRAGELVTREDLRLAVWGQDAFVDFDAGLNFGIRQLRLALGDDANVPRYIQTVPRRGYRFIAIAHTAPRAPHAPVVHSTRDSKPFALIQRAGLVAALLIITAIASAYGALTLRRSDPARDGDARIADAHAAHGFVALNDRWDWLEAERAFTRALQLDPAQEVALISMSRLHASLGRHDAAIAFAQRAVNAHPQSDRSLVTLGWAHLFAGDASTALRICGQVIERHPDSAPGRWCVLNATADAGGVTVDTWRRLGESMDVRQPVPSAFVRACVLARSGAVDEAMESLATAFATREPDATFALVHPAFATMRARPEFVEMADRAGLRLDLRQISASTH